MQSQIPAIEASPDGDSGINAGSLVRSLSRRYLFVLIAVAVLVVIDQAIIQPLLIELNHYAPAINVAGRQRMLSQRITKEALALAASNDETTKAARRAELNRAVDQWTAANRALLEGNRTLGLDPIDAPHVASALRELEPSLSTITSAARKLVQPATATDGLVPLAEILQQEPIFLQGMERVVAMLEASAGRRVALLRLCGLAAMAAVLGLLVAVYFIVLRPATVVIRGQVGQLAESEARSRRIAGLLGEARDELESRVARRTLELSTANLALEREMSERQTAEARMRELSAQLAQASRVTALGQLATGLAHEINHPLATITNYAETVELSLGDEPVDIERARKVVDQIKQAALRAGRIVHRMRNFVRPGTTHVSRVELADLVREVCDLCRPQLEQMNVQLTVAIAPGSSWISADAVEIQQVLVNLVQNAMQALATCPRELRTLQIRTSSGGDEVRVELLDSGPGFPADCVDSSFAAFFSSKADGLGMGLAISRAILERYQGRIWAENPAEGGALVRFCLPISPAHDAESRTHTHCLCR
ncbi:MAG: ATP-binding protein [Pirellulales bacterium]